jgi:hypothetical protein
MVLRRAIVIGFVALVAGFVIATSLRRANEPRYEGRALSSWFGELCRVSSIYEAGGRKSGDLYLRHLECQIAILGMGTNALPFLVREAFRLPSSSAFRDLVYTWSMRLPEWAGKGLMLSPGRRAGEARQLLEVLRPPAPMLLSLLGEALAEPDRLAARTALAEIRWRELCRARGLRTN